jgi:hypothetical protein
LPRRRRDHRRRVAHPALKEYGALRRTVYAARYLSDPDYRRKISRQLNKGESLHALRRDLLYAHEGRLLPYQDSWNTSHGDAGRDTAHGFVNETLIFASVAAIPALAALLPGDGIWPGSWPFVVQVLLAVSRTSTWRAAAPG